jgi:hypothetical protein
VVGPRTKRGRLALALAALGGAVLVASALRSWVEPAHVAWPSYADGVPDWIARPSDVLLRVAAAFVGVAALLLVGLARRRRLEQRLAWALLASLGLGGVALGLLGLESTSHHPAFGSIEANDMTLYGFRYGLLNYVELAGAALLCVSPLAAVRTPASSPTRPRSGAARGGRAGTGSRTRRPRAGGRR